MMFSEKLTALRKKAGLSQEELAQQLGVTRQSVSKWEGGTAVPELVKVITLSELFGVSVDYLVEAFLSHHHPNLWKPLLRVLGEMGAHIR